MNIDFFKQTRILDGGMGQELLARGMKPSGTLWSATALLKKKYHKLLLDTHLDFIKAGAEVIVTTTFTTRKTRLRDNHIENKFEYLNKSKTGNPNEFLGQRKDLTPYKMAKFAKKFKDAGATILGGCCETRPQHIKEFSKLV